MHAVRLGNSCDTCYGLVPTAQWKGVEMKKVPLVSACSTAARHSAASSAFRVGRMPPCRNRRRIGSEKVLMNGNILVFSNS